MLYRVHLAMSLIRTPNLCTCTYYSNKIEIDIAYKYIGAVMVLLVWLLDLQLPIQSVPITTNVVSSNQAQYMYIDLRFQIQKKD
jgi:hypothetical protein